MAYGDRYLVETRSQTIRLITPEEADDLGRILSSQRYVITGTDPRFKRLLAHGYRLANPQPRRVRPFDAVMNEHIPMPGFPQIIVTRGFAHQWLRAHGWDESEHGYGSLDYSIFQTRATSEPLTDPAERDRYLNDPGVSRGLSRNRDRNPQTGVHTINSDTLPVLRSVASSYGQSKLVKTFTGTTASETHRKAEILEQQGKTDGQQLEIFHVHGKSGTYGYAPSGLLDQATDAQESERDQDSGPDPREAARAEKAKKSLESKLLKVRGEYQDKAERLIDEANRALDKYLGGDSVEAAQVAGKVERGCQEADKGGGRGLKAACKVFVRELTRVENPNRQRNIGIPQWMKPKSCWYHGTIEDGPDPGQEMHCGGSKYKLTGTGVEVNPRRKSTSWGVRKETYKGEGIYWGGSYNVEGNGDYGTIAEAREAVDRYWADREEKERLEASSKLASGAIAVERSGDVVHLTYPDRSTESMPIREFRLKVYDIEEKWGVETVWV